MTSGKYLRITRQIGVSYVSSGMVFLLGPLLTYLLTRNLTVAEYGAFSIFLVIVNVSAVILDFAFSHYMVNKFPGLSRRKMIKSFIPLLAFSFISALLIVLFLAFTPFKDVFIQTFGLTGYWFEFQLLMILVFMGIPLRVMLGYLSAKKEIELSSILVFVRQSFWVFLLFVFIWAMGGLTLLNVMYLWIAGFAIAFILCLYWLRKDFAYFFSKIKKVSWVPIRTGLIYGLPLMPYLIGSWIVAVSDRFFLGYYMTLDQVGIYSLAYVLANIVFSFGIVMSGIFYPYVAEAWNKGEVIIKGRVGGSYNFLINASLKYSLIVIISSAVGLFVLREHIVMLLSGQAYILAASVIPILLVYPIFACMVTILQQTLMVRNRTKTIGVIYTFVAFLTIALNFLLVPILGMFGVALAVSLSYVVLFLLIYYVSRSYFKVNWVFLKIGRIISASLAMGLFVFFLNLQGVGFEIPAILLGVVVYILMLFVFKVFVDAEIKILRKVILKVLKRVKLK